MLITKTKKYEVDVCVLGVLHYILGETDNRIFLIDNESDLSQYKALNDEHYKKRFEVFSINAIKSEKYKGLHCVINLDILAGVSKTRLHEFDLFGEDLTFEQKLSIITCARFIDAFYRDDSILSGGMSLSQCVLKLKQLFDLDSRNYEDKLIFNAVKVNK